MSLLVPAALAFSIIIPIILLLYFIRPKRQERVVGSTLLWQQALEDLQASRPWQRLHITPLLLLQILAAILIVLLLARPATFISNPISGDTILILQASASMQATDVQPSRFEEAKNRVSDLIANLGPDDRLSLITMARVPQVLIAESQDKGQLAAALQRAQVTNQDADLVQALSLATSLAAGRSNVKILVIGDGHVLTPDQPLTLPNPVSYLRIGTDAPNVALLALASRNSSGTLVALAQIANYSSQQRSIPVALYADGKLAGVQTLALAPGGSGALSWSPLPPTSRFLHAHILTQDSLSIDSDAWATVGSSIHGRVLLVTKGNSFLEAALRLQTGSDVYETTPAKYTTARNFDLVIFDGFVPAELPNTNIFFINPPPGSYLFGKSGAEQSVSQISTGTGNSDQTLLQNIDLSSIHVLHFTHQLTPAQEMQSIITTPQTPLLLAGQINNRRVATLGFDLHDSDLPLQPSFPILMFNLLNWFMPSPVPGDSQVAPGTPVTIQTWPGANKVTITPPTAPDQQPVLVAPPFPALPYAKTNTIGIYTVTQEVRGSERYGAFAVNLFDPQQSHLAPATSLPVVHSTNFTSGGNSVPRVLHEIWPEIAALFLLILCLEWWLFGRGYMLKARSTDKSLDTSSIGGRGKRLRPPARSGRFVLLQNQVQSRYRTTMKRISKVTRRFKRRIGSNSQSNLGYSRGAARLRPFYQHPSQWGRTKRVARSKGNRHVNL